MWIIIDLKFIDNYTHIKVLNFEYVKKYILRIFYGLFFFFCWEGTSVVKYE